LKLSKKCVIPTHNCERIQSYLFIFNIISVCAYNNKNNGTIKRETRRRVFIFRILKSVFFLREIDRTYASLRTTCLNWIH